ncbi:MAG: LptA/OstA family protein [Hyphomicrobiales bacterium]
MMRRLALIAALIAPLAAAAPAAAQSSKSKEVNITADRMEILDAEGRAVFTGKVDAKRGDVRLTSDKLVAIYTEVKQTDGSSKQEVTRLEAEGSVTIVTAKQTITGQWAKMDVNADKLEVGGKVKVVQGQTVLQGELLNVDLAADKSEMTGGRVKGSFVPQ